MKRYWVYFRGTRNGAVIEATTMLSAKWMFAKLHNITSLDYIAASKSF